MSQQALYENQFLNIRIVFPEGWKFRYWGSWKRPPQEIDRYQISDFDMPTEIHDEKLVLNAVRLVRGGPCIISSSFLVSLFWRKDALRIEDELAEALAKPGSRIEPLCIGKWQGNSVLLDIDCGSHTLKRHYFVCEVQPKIWLSTRVEGDSHENFDQAMQVLRSVSN